MTIKAIELKSAFDVRTGNIVNAESSGIMDVVSVLQSACRTAVTTAALALTTDVLIHRRQVDPVRQAHHDRQMHRARRGVQ